jgi:hypothetical protein
MTILSALVAILSVAIGVAHSAIGEKMLLGPLYLEHQTGALRTRPMQAILRAVWHLPSLAWALVGLTVFAARLSGGIGLVSLLAVVFFAVSGLANLAALRRPHIGGILLLCAAALASMDWYIQA